MPEQDGRERVVAMEATPSLGGKTLCATSFAKIIDDYQGPLLRYVGRMVGSKDGLSEDIVQECFLRLHRTLGKKNEPEIRRVSPWLFTVAHNLTMDAIRKRDRRRTIQERINNEIDQVDEIGVLGRITQSRAAAAAMKALNILTNEQKQVVLMKVVEGMTFRQIAKVTGLSLGSVNNRLNQGLIALAGKLKHLGHM